MGDLDDEMLLFMGEINALSEPTPAQAPAAAVVASAPQLKKPAPAPVPQGAMTSAAPVRATKIVDKATDAQVEKDKAKMSLGFMPVTGPGAPKEVAKKEKDKSKDDMDRRIEEALAASKQAAAQKAKPQAESKPMGMLQGQMMGKPMISMPDRPKYNRQAAGKAWFDPTIEEWPEDDYRIFVGDLGNEVNDETLALAFKKYPSFHKAKIVREKWNHKSKGYGFVSLMDPADGGRALKDMNGKYIGNRPCKLRKSTYKDRVIGSQKTIGKKKKKGNSKKHLPF